LPITSCAGAAGDASHADPVIFAPNHTAGQVQSKARYIQLKPRGDSRLVRDLYGGSGRGEVANYAVDGAITKLDDCTFRNKVSLRSCFPTFNHSPSPYIK
jgi:hypothetical protein